MMMKYNSRALQLLSQSIIRRGTHGRQRQCVVVAMPWSSSSSLAVYPHDLNPAAASRTFSSSVSSSTMSQLKELRALSGAPIVDCKKALAETEGNIEEALDWLRQHGVAKANKKLSGRDAEEGLIACAVLPDYQSASIVKVSSETDFAGKSTTFVNLAHHVAQATLHNKVNDDVEVVQLINPESLMVLEYDSKSVQTMLEEAIVAIRENLGISSAIKMTTTTKGDSMIVPYVHGKVAGDGGSSSSNVTAGSAASIVEISGKGVVDDPRTALEIGKKLAMHIVAAKPLYLDPESIPDDILQKEKAMLETQIADSKKPPEVIEKIVTGRLKKYYSEVCLTEQEHMVEEGNPKVSKSLKDHGLVVNGFQMLYI